MHDFNGTWKCTEVRNMDEFLEALDVAWLKRKAGSIMGFGVNRLVQTVTQSGDKIAITNVGGIKDFANEIRVGHGPQTMESMDGPVTGTPTWADDGSLVLETEMKGKAVTLLRRRVSPTTTELETIHNGVSAIRVFTLQEDNNSGH
ncbi:hypothetical protein SDRG_07132 [Saprolegnia diclina VS20]|uniref:Cytosolic fatty-acid binding proteins domain-containing protein n=1 Tax=Saprolegnia diclina (strain VS20) TaxID=1156394 RepID=T0RYG0_SAPDV|nr:hypothetical protein SDRG_07132 [Saprolegnia diclina VS20]EQC35422.1 hypothetical protein SDRG_07132 [Saprolegnia diclina VS20]|eukprot:XP_008611172.1 hypothetical protein SDRG_07132 [Saprolegnia diclina VS20]